MLETESQNTNIIISPLRFLTYEELADDKNTSLVNISDDFHNSTLNEYISILNAGDRVTIKKNHSTCSQDQLSPKSHHRRYFQNHNPANNETNQNIYRLRFDQDGNIS